MGSTSESSGATKTIPTTPKAEVEGVAVNGSGGEDMENRHCVICSDEGCEKIVRDQNYFAVMGLYWQMIKADVKPEMNKQLALCLPCFDSLLQLYQINDVLMYFEAKLRETQKQILNMNIKGLVSWQEKGLKLFPFQAQIMRECGTKLEVTKAADEAEKKRLNSFHVIQNQVEDDNDIENIEKEMTKIMKESESPSSTSTSGKKRNATSSERDHKEREHSPQKKKNKTKKIKVVIMESGGDSGSEEEAEKGAKGGSGSAGKERATSTRRAAVAARKKCHESGDDEKESPSDPSTGTGEKQCKICLDVFATSSQFIKHGRQHKVKEDEGIYECRNCPEHFTNRNKFIDHKKDCIQIID